MEIKKLNKNAIKRLTILIPTALHQEIKVLGAKYNMTMTKWVMKAIVDSLRSEIN